jgi:DNA-directed RNA polymerase specialized sigma24 family protein
VTSQGNTSLGDGEGQFPTTHWSVIGEARPDSKARSRQLIGDLLQHYWKPVYCYLRRKGHGNEQAKDLTQGFFCEIVLNRHLIQRADAHKGRFRTYLLTALQRYVANVHRDQTTHKCIPADKLLPLDDAVLNRVPQVAEDFTCEESFNYAWVTNLLDWLHKEVEADCRQRGMTLHWTLFYERVVRPVVEDSKPPPLARLCEKHDIEEPTRASNMIFAVKRQFRTKLKNYLRQSVTSEGHEHKEMIDLTRFLSRE